jgi:hypothetical protein
MSRQKSDAHAAIGHLFGPYHTQKLKYYKKN